MGPSLLLLFDFDSGCVPKQYKWWSEGLRTISSVSKTHRLNQRKSRKQIHNARRVSSGSVPGQSSLMKTPKSSFLKKKKKKKHLTAHRQAGLCPATHNGSLLYSESVCRPTAWPPAQNRWHPRNKVPITSQQNPSLFFKEDRFNRSALLGPTSEAGCCHNVWMGQLLFGECVALFTDAILVQTIHAQMQRVLPTVRL